MTIQGSETAKKLHPLSSTEQLLYPFFAPFLRGERGEHLRRRYHFTRELHQRRADLRRAKREILREARKFAQLIADRWALMGFASYPKDEVLGATKRRARRIRKVRFELVRFNEHAIYLKVWVRKPGLFGYRNMLPYRVRVVDLLSDETLRELEFAVDRKVTSVYDQPRNGAWVIIHRNESGGLLPKLVRFQHMLPYHDSSPDLAAFVLGVGENNTVHTSSLALHPHILIAGASRSGKSNMLNNILASLVRFCTPEQLQLVLIDPKRVELSHYADAPQLARDIVYNESEAIDLLKWANEEIDRRTEMMTSRKKKNIRQWNVSYPEQSLPRLVIVVEEVASLYTDSDGSKRKVQRLVRRIASMGAAMGVHLIMCTQMPVVEVIPNPVKVNMLLALSGKVMNTDQSRVILGVGAAAKLPDIPGRMIAAREAKVFELQTPLIEDEDIAECIAIARGRAAGLIALHGYEPCIVPSELMKYIYDKLGGVLSTTALIPKLSEFGITAAMLKPFLEDVKAGRVKLSTVEIERDMPSPEPVTREFGIDYHAPKLFPAPLTAAELGLRADTALTSPDGDYDDVDEGEAVQTETDEVSTVETTQTQETTIRWIKVKPNPPPLPGGEPLSIEELGLLERVQAEVIPDDETIFHDFIQACCAIGRLEEVKSARLYETYSVWCARQRYRTISKQKFGQKLKNAGFKQKRTTGGYHVWLGLSLKLELGSEVGEASGVSEALFTAHTHDSEG